MFIYLLLTHLDVYQYQKQVCAFIVRIFSVRASIKHYKVLYTLACITACNYTSQLFFNAFFFFNIMISPFNDVSITSFNESTNKSVKQG